MAGRSDWIDAGLRILETEGAPAVTIERLTERLGLSKGSFYHHFKGMPAFRTALLERFEADYTTAYIDVVELGPERPAIRKIHDLIELVATDDPSSALEVAVRAWAQQDPEVRVTQERIDRTRLDYVQWLWEELTGEPVESARLARLCYLILIGGDHLIPAVSQAEMREILTTVVDLATASLAADGRTAKHTERNPA
ncbi:TetR/AcrR family transcriptional regulator [Spirillospora sp. CA-294931]|uniref:TetR/AcrR family transcriptional regulator n=1 Tax=Spirillospora sp. CA-294931 TaxID=3240042 RepID=UPI003D9262AF